MNLVNYFNGHVGESLQEIEISAIKTNKLSTIRKKKGKSEVKKQLYLFIKMIVGMLRVKQPMSETEIRLLVPIVYKDYYWLTLEQLFDFSMQLVTGKLDENYGRLDIKTFMNKLREWDSKRESNWQGKALLSNNEETKLLSGSKGVPMPKELLQLAHRIKVRSSIAFKDVKVKDDRTVIQKFDDYLLEKGLKKESLGMYKEVVLEEWKKFYDSSSNRKITWEKFKEKMMAKTMYYNKNEWRRHIR